MKVLVLATSRKTRGGVTAVINMYRQSPMWTQFNCRWIETHRDGGVLVKVAYLVKALLQYAVCLPFYDIVHIHIGLIPSAKRKYIFWRLAKMLKKKTVIHLHCGSQIEEIWTRVYRIMFEQSDCAIVLSSSIKRIIEQHTGPSDRIRVVYNPCPEVCIKDGPKDNILLFSGTVCEAKGYKDLIRAFSKVAAKHTDWKLVLAGNGEIAQAHGLAEELGVADKVVIPGWVRGEDKDRLFSCAGAFCLPSYAEGLPMAVLEAFAYGLPVITTPVGAIPDIADNGQNVLLFDCGDVDELANSIEKVISDRVLRERLADNGRKLATTVFSLETVSNQIAGIYFLLSDE